MILLATGNSHKVAEIQALLKNIPLRTVEEKWHYEEGLESLAANAIGKAQSARVYAKPGEIVLAEDTGLFVDALNGDPGVASARYAGENVNFEQNIRKLLSELTEVASNQRNARFLTSCAAILPDGTFVMSVGRLEGKITSKPVGGGGFGYDPIFFVPETGKTLAEMTPAEKNVISHRARALKIIRSYLVPDRKVSVLSP